MQNPWIEFVGAAPCGRPFFASCIEGVDLYPHGGWLKENSLHSIFIFIVHIVLLSKIPADSPSAVIFCY